MIPARSVISLDENAPRSSRRFSRSPAVSGQRVPDKPMRRCQSQGFEATSFSGLSTPCSDGQMSRGRVHERTPTGSVPPSPGPSSARSALSSRRNTLTITASERLFPEDEMAKLRRRGERESFIQEERELRERQRRDHLAQEAEKRQARIAKDIEERERREKKKEEQRQKRLWDIEERRVLAEKRAEESASEVELDALRRSPRYDWEKEPSRDELWRQMQQSGRTRGEQEKRRQSQREARERVRIAETQQEEQQHRQELAMLEQFRSATENRRRQEQMKALQQKEKRQMRAEQRKQIRVRTEHEERLREMQVYQERALDRFHKEVDSERQQRESVAAKAERTAKLREAREAKEAMKKLQSVVDLQKRAAREERDALERERLEQQKEKERVQRLRAVEARREEAERRQHEIARMKEEEEEEETSNIRAMMSSRDSFRGSRSLPSLWHINAEQSPRGSVHSLAGSRASSVCDVACGQRQHIG
mmetsp:Transcript_46266/g.122755  ORF Transcript_46266/g.122755 Transcript_46266/m.122755 type:complete len:480 (-) Transcript_46266:26-1465(-)